MFALIVLELSNLSRVAGGARIRYFACKGNVQRRMRVFVAAETALKFEVGLPHMAVAALRNRLLDCGRMADMTARTPDFLVLSSGGCYVGRWSIMTLQAVVVRQNRLCLGRRRHAGTDKKHRDSCDHEQYDNDSTASK